MAPLFPSFQSVNGGSVRIAGSRAPFDQLAEIVDAVGDRIDVIMDGGIQRGTHVLKALSLGAKAVGARGLQDQRLRGFLQIGCIESSTGFSVPKLGACYF